MGDSIRREASNGIKSEQHLYVSPSFGIGVATIDITIDEVDIANTLLSYVRTHTSSGARAYITIDFLNSTTLRLERASTTNVHTITNVLIDIEEYYPGIISKQTFTLNSSDVLTTATLAITSVDLTRSKIYHQGMRTTGLSGGNLSHLVPLWKFNSATEIEIQVLNTYSSSASTYLVDVVEHLKG
jgi:hypothetical protein